MNFIQERREHTLAENNTAQNQILDLLDISLPSISELIVKTPLYGDLDFEVLEKCNFKNITSILLPPGEITSIRNLPDTITRLICAENLLIELRDLPKSIQVIEVPNNGLTHIDFNSLPKLIKADVTFNHLEIIENLSKTVEELLCDNNHIKRLNLIGTENLRVLHCSNNGLMRIENMPESISDFVMENNPLIEIHYKGSSTLNIHEKTIEIEYTEAIKEYFKWKQEYEVKTKDQKKNVYQRIKEKSGIKKAQKEALRVKPACIFCKKPVGMIFRRVENNLIGLCGNSHERCLDVKIYTGEYINVHDFLKEYKSIEEAQKQDIITLKYDTLFDYITEAESTKNSKIKIEEYNSSMEMIKEFDDKYENIYFNPDRDEKIQKKKIEIAIIRNNLNELYRTYLIEKNPEVLKTLLDIYSRELVPNIEILRRLKYEVLEMDLYDNTYHLVQKVATASNIDCIIGESPKVVKWVKK